jgi:hypothetical protein
LSVVTGSFEAVKNEGPFASTLFMGTPNGPRFLTVGLPEQDFHLVLWPGTLGKAEPVYGRSPATCTIEMPDIRKAFEELKAKGVQFETEVLEYPWGWVAVFLDLDGNRLQVRHGR